MQIELISPDVGYAELWMKWRQETSSVRFNPLMPTTLEKIRERLASARGDFSDLHAAAEYSLFARLPDGRVAGSLTLKGISHTQGYAEIGYTIGEEFQGKGVGTAAVRAFVAKIFFDTPLRRIYAHVAEGNVASRKLLERIGFRNEGTLREHYLIQGVPTNEVVYGILRGELKELPSA